MNILGIETSCDETAASVVRDDEILTNVVSSSVPLHRAYGGVIPEVASRCHIEYINRVTKKALSKSDKDIRDINLIAVTDAPGLPGSLVAGVAFAKALSYALKIPCVNVNHVHAHLYANFLDKKKREDKFPFIGVVVSGGHTNVYLCKNFKDPEIIGRTKDDAIGEAFDKVAKILGIGYPGGPHIERYASKFKGKPIKFPRAFLDKDSYDFSLSGVKTAVLYYVKSKKLDRREISRVAWSFQEAVFDVLIERVLKACTNFNIRKVFLGGGVVSNMRLRSKLIGACSQVNCEIYYPPPALCVDNAAMIAGLGGRLYNK